MERENDYMKGIGYLLSSDPRSLHELERLYERNTLKKNEKQEDSVSNQKSVKRQMEKRDTAGGGSGIKKFE